MGQEVNLGTGSEVSIGDLVQRINTIIGRDLPVRKKDERVRPETSEVNRLLSNNSKARDLVGLDAARHAGRGDPAHGEMGGGAAGNVRSQRVPDLNESNDSGRWNGHTPAASYVLHSEAIAAGW